MMMIMKIRRRIKKENIRKTKRKRNIRKMEKKIKKKRNIKKIRRKRKTKRENLKIAIMIPRNPRSKRINIAVILHNLFN